MSTGKPLTFHEFPYAGADPRYTPALIDGRTGQVIEDTSNSCDHPQQTLASGFAHAAEIAAPILRNSGGFGPAVKLLEVEPFRLAPWLTPEICEQEIAMQGTKGS